MTLHIKSLLGSYMQSKSGWRLKLLTDWPHIMGTLTEHVTIEKIYPEMLVLGVTDSCWLQELHLLSETIRQKINETLDQQRIKQIRFKHVMKKQSENKKSTMKYFKKKVPKILNFSEKKALALITDPHLKSALESFLNRCHQESKK